MMSASKVFYIVVAATIFMATLPLTNGQSCATTSDCVPSSCCHARSCVHISKMNVSECDGVLCTAQCIPYTLDCGGVCLCQIETGQCQAVMRVGVAPEGGPTKAPEPPKNKKYVKITFKTTVKK